ncbi:LytR/AlgR family response regulator transcription factor [Arsenicibacter rosenii]|uniref:DNA-binding response regulator n=1 Tax=Arsenicibacter rosenii TaxID=1750698 RepID=A0A1S2V9V7_9BACT|nr:LytTR family DNA-binding domain-containing protein [Arsenicibacter rosenii]OIN55462.1 DNA-binding response regulator [Arsenicibacter rosenii]
MSEKLTCYLIDDEGAAHHIMSKYIERVPYLHLLGKNTDPFDGLDKVQEYRPDILFLDVEMPYMTGVEFLRSLPQPHPEVIMVTASPQFAAETYSFESVAHYLLKPVGFDKFLEAINRVTKRLGFSVDPTASIPTRPLAKRSLQEKIDPRENVPYFLIKTDKKLVRVAPADILFAEGMKDYIRLQLADQLLIAHMTMTKMEEMLPPSQFLRVHRSFIVRMEAIKEIDGNMITTLDGQKRVQIGVTYRETVLEKLKRNMV